MKKFQSCLGFEVLNYPGALMFTCVSKCVTPANNPVSRLDSKSSFVIIVHGIVGEAVGDEVGVLVGDSDGAFVGYLLDVSCGDFDGAFTEFEPA